MVGAVRIELTTSWTRTRRATRLRYAPNPKRSGTWETAAAIAKVFWFRRRISPAATTSSASGSSVANAGAYQLTGVSFNNSSSTVTVADPSKLVPGLPLSGTGLAAGTVSTAILDATHITVSATPTGSATGSSYTTAVSNSMLSDNTGVPMLPKGLKDPTGTGTGNLNAVNNHTVVGKVNGTYGTTPGYQRVFSLSQLRAASSSGTTTSGSATGTGDTGTANLFVGETGTGTGIPCQRYDQDH